MPDPLREEFRSPNVHGHWKVVAQSISEDGKRWVRGWTFTLYDGSDKEVDHRFLDHSEMKAIQKLLKTWSDESVKIAYEYRSIEGIVFKKFEGNQRVGILTPGYGQRIGIDGQIVDGVFKFLKSSSELWEK
jgi:hypothetical protein